MGNTLAFRSDEGRVYRRNASGSWKKAMIRRSPNEPEGIQVLGGFLFSNLLAEFCAALTLLASGLSIFLFMLYLLDLPLPEFIAPPRIYLCELIIGNNPPPFFLEPLGSSELNLAAL